MATLIELDAVGDLNKIDPGLPLNVLEERVIYASPKLTQWLQDELPLLGSTWGIELDPIEQLAVWIETYASGKPLKFGWAFSPLRPISNGVWELKTADLRVFGWFHKVDHFVAHRAHCAQHIKDYKLYNGMAGEVIRFRDQLDLNAPKFIEGDDPNAVVSNFCYP